MFRPFVKFVSAIVSALLISLYWSISSYTPMAERMDDVAYYSSGFWYGFTIVLLINLAIFLILVMPLSNLMDGIVMSRLQIRNGKRIFLMIIAYGVMGVICGIIFAIFVHATENLRSIMLMFVMLTLVYLLCQYIIKWLFSKARQRK
jgi:L-lactate permease